MTASASRLEEITSANLDAALAVRVRPGQEHAVEPVVRSLAEAYVRPGVAWPGLIVDGDRPVGFLMACSDIDRQGDGSGPSAPDCGGAAAAPGEELRVGHRLAGHLPHPSSRSAVGCLTEGGACMRRGRAGDRGT